MEGVATFNLIKNHWDNTIGDYCKDRSDYCDKLKKFLQDNLDYMNKKGMYGFERRSETNLLFYMKLMKNSTQVLTGIRLDCYFNKRQGLRMDIIVV